MKWNPNCFRSKKSLSVVLIALTVVSACKSMEFFKQKVENQSEFEPSAATESCGTVLSIGSLGKEPSKNITLKVQAAVCGYLEGHDQPWQAIGLTVDSSEVNVLQASSIEGVKALLSLDGERLFAEVSDKKILLGTVQGEVVQDAKINLLDNTKLEILVDGKPYVPGRIEDKMKEMSLEVLVTVR